MPSCVCIPASSTFASVQPSSTAIRHEEHPHPHPRITARPPALIPAHLHRRRSSPLNPPAQHEPPQATRRAAGPVCPLPSGPAVTSVAHGDPSGPRSGSASPLRARSHRSTPRGTPSPSAHTVSAQLRVEFPRPAALLRRICRRHRRLRSPTKDFDTPRAISARRNPSRDPPKIPLRRLPSASLRSPRLGSGDLSLLFARNRWAQKEKRNVPQSR